MSPLRLKKILLKVRRMGTLCCKRLPEIGVQYEDWAGKGFQEKRRPGKVLVVKHLREFLFSVSV